MGADHARILASQVPGAAIQAIYDADPARAQVIAEETGAGTVVADAAALIRDPAIDAVLVATPDQTHKELVLACIAARKPVLCEKPLAPTVAECLEVIAAEAKLGRKLVQIGYMRRFDPAYVEMKASLISGRLGAPLIFHCVHRNVSAPAWFDSRMAVSNSAVHEFDIARWLLETELTSIQVFRPKAAAQSSPGAPVFLVLESAKGQLVNIEVFIDATSGYDVRGELVCERGPSHCAHRSIPRPAPIWHKERPTPPIGAHASPMRIAYRRRRGSARSQAERQPAPVPGMDMRQRRSPRAGCKRWRGTIRWRSG